MRHVATTRYVVPLREGGSLPAIVEGADLGLYVMKFRGAGQGPKALVAELLGAVLGRAMGLNAPEAVLMTLPKELARNEPHDEIRDLLHASIGLNLGLDYLPGAITFDPHVPPAPDALMASKIVAFDAFMMNVDRTVRNPNLLEWHGRLWAIDHGAALYFHHGGLDWLTAAQSGFGIIAQHVLLPFATQLEEAWVQMAPTLTDEVLRAAVEQIPNGWLGESSEALKAGYLQFFAARLSHGPKLIEEASRARARLL